jgi:hypothetical protein
MKESTEALGLRCDILISHFAAVLRGAMAVLQS